MHGFAPHFLARLLPGIACAALLLLASAPAASALVRYASPSGSGSGECTSPDPLHPTDPPCTLQRAAEDVTDNGDEVIVNPGVYNEASEVTIANTGVVLHGVAGQPRPEIDAAVGYGVRVTGAGSSVRYLRVRGDDGGIRFSAAGSGDQIIARQDTLFRVGCEVTDAAGSVTLTNSVCHGDPDGAGLIFQANVNVGTQTLTLRNVSARSADVTTGANGIVLFAEMSSNLTLDAKNVIAQGETDVSAGTNTGGTAAANLAFSNYDTRLQTGGTVTDPATGNNQMTPPVLADDNLHQAANSPTINAGTAVGLLGAADVDGDPRTLGGAPDIGADEFVPAAAAAVPAAPSNAFTVGKLDGKTLTLNVDSPGTVDVTDAGAQASTGGAFAAAKKLLKPSSASGGPGTIEVMIKLTKAAKQKLRRKGKVRVNARITFTPNGGTANSLTQKLKIKKRK
jgi:hypothetical protein